MMVESSRPTCNEDYVLVYDVGHTGNLKELDRVCNVKVPTSPLYSPWSKKEVVHTEDDTFINRGYMDVNVPTAPLYSSWSKMKIILNIDDAISNRGFMAEYHSKTFQIPDRLLQDIHFDGKLYPLPL